METWHFLLVGCIVLLAYGLALKWSWRRQDARRAEETTQVRPSLQNRIELKTYLPNGRRFEQTLTFDTEEKTVKGLSIITGIDFVDQYNHKLYGNEYSIVIDDNDRAYENGKLVYDRRAEELKQDAAI